jgi:hypothetical protein
MTLRIAFFQSCDEIHATEHLAAALRPYNSQFVKVENLTDDPFDTPKRKLQKKVPLQRVFFPGGINVCTNFYRAVYGILKDKFARVRLLLQKQFGSVLTKNVLRTRDPSLYHQAKAFWHQFFKLCQRPNESERLFPLNTSYPVIYSEYFVPWVSKASPNEERASLTTLIRARHDDDFKDVKDRPKHYHARCGECSILMAKRLSAFKNQEEAEQYNKEFIDHENEKLGWRAFEKMTQLQAKHSPYEYSVYWFDDTEFMGLPRLTLRPPKALTQTRFAIVPSLLNDLGRSREYYVYTVKKRFKKGANRLCTMLYKAFRATR